LVPDIWLPSVLCYEWKIASAPYTTEVGIADRMH